MNPASPIYPSEISKETMSTISDVDHKIQTQIDKGVLEPSMFANKGTSSNFKSYFSSLLKKTEEGLPVFVHIKGVLMPMEITESKIQEGNDVQTQINDPLYKEELITKHSDIKHYAIKLKDPHKDQSALTLAKQQKIKLEEIYNKYADGDEVSSEEESFFDQAKKDFACDFSDVLLMKDMEIDSLKSIYEKPAISIRISEDGEIGEVASIGSQSSHITGSDLMKGVDEFCHMLGVKRMYLEDDAAIESPNGNYSLRLFRYYNDKNSWYEDSFQYKPYEKNYLDGSISESAENSQSRLGSAIHFMGKLTIKEMMKILDNPDINQRKTEGIKRSLEQEDPKTTLKEKIQDLGQQIMRDRKPLHKEMSTYLKDFLEALDSYTGSDQEFIELKKNANKILNSRFFAKSYT